MLPIEELKLRISNSLPHIKMHYDPPEITTGFYYIDLEYYLRWLTIEYIDNTFRAFHSFEDTGIILKDTDAAYSYIANYFHAK